MSFLQSHLADILALLVEPSQLLPSGHAPQDCQVCSEDRSMNFHLSRLWYRLLVLTVLLLQFRGFGKFWFFCNKSSFLVKRS